MVNFMLQFTTIKKNNLKFSWLARHPVHLKVEEGSIPGQGTNPGSSLLSRQGQPIDFLSHRLLSLSPFLTLKQ